MGDVVGVDGYYPFYTFKEREVLASHFRDISMSIRKWFIRIQFFSGIRHIIVESLSSTFRITKGT